MRSDVAVLFDLDGVLVDSRAQHLEAWQRFAKEHGINAPAGYFDRTFGLRNDAILGGLIEGITIADIERLGGEKERIFREIIGEPGLQPLLGAPELLDFLDKEQIPRAVVTSTPRANLDMVLRLLGISGCFQALVSAEDTSKGKPDPEGFLLGAERLGGAPEHCVVIEDAPAGIQAAKAAGMRAIGVTTTHAAPDLAGADLVVESLAEEGVPTFIVR